MSFNRSAEAGEQADTCDDSQLIWGGDVSCYSIVNGVFTPMSQVSYDSAALAAAKASRLRLMQAAYITATNAPIQFTTAGGTTAMFPTGDTVVLNGKTAKENIYDLTTAGDGAWRANTWLDVNNAPVTPFTFADIQALAAAIEAADTPDFQELLIRLGQIQAAPDIATVNAINW